MGPLPHTCTARIVSVGRGLGMVFMTVKKARIASRPRTVAMLGGISTASTA